MISTSDIVLAVQLGLALGAIPAFCALLVGIFWRVIYIMQ